MKVSTYVRTLSLMLLYLANVFVITGCGGGTGGTDGGTPIKLIGTVYNTEGEVLEDVEVTLLESGDSTRTDSSGNFLLESTLVGVEATLELSKAGESAVVAFEVLPYAQASISITLIFDPLKGSASVESLSTDELENPDEDDGKSPNDNPDKTPPYTSRLSGTVIGARGTPLSGVRLSLREVKNASIKSNRSGDFSFEFPGSSRSLNLDISYQGFKATVALGHLPDYAVDIRMTLRLSVASEPLSPNEPTRTLLKVQVDSKQVTRR